MSYVVIWSATALESLQGVRDYISLDSTRAAERIIADLIRLGESLAEMPGRGRLVEPGVRELVYRSYLLRYRIEADIVIVVRLKHSAQWT